MYAIKAGGREERSGRNGEVSHPGTGRKPLAELEKATDVPIPKTAL